MQQEKAMLAATLAHLTGAAAEDLERETLEQIVEDINAFLAVYTHDSI